MCQSEVFSLSKKLLMNLRKDVIYCGECSLSGASGEKLFSFCAAQLKQKFQRKSGLILATGIDKTKLSLSCGIISSLSIEEIGKKT